MRDLMPSVTVDDHRGTPRLTPSGLNDAEQRLWQAFPVGEEVVLGDGASRDGAKWGKDRTIRADIIASLLAGARNGSRAPRAALLLTGAKVTGVLNLHHLDVDAPVLFTDCWFSDVPLLAQTRTTTVTFTGCRLPGLSARQLEVRGDLDLSRSTVDGQVVLQDARVGGVLSLSGARLAHKKGCALDADGVTVSGGLVADRKFTALGEVRLRNATIDRQVTLTGARISNRTGYALNADNLTVSGSMFADGHFTVTGETRLPGATIDGQLHLSGARLTNKSGPALHAPQLTVTGDVFAGDDLTVTGETSLLGARIGGQLVLSGAKLRNDGGCALNATRLTVTGDLFADDGFTAVGETRLTDATIGGQVLFLDATLEADGDALCLADGKVGELWLLFATPPTGTVRLTGLTARLLVDHPDAWPATLRLDGCTYTRLHAREISHASRSASDTTVSVRQRLRWLRRDPRYSPQPYEQLAEHYRRIGNDAAARRVLVAKHRRHRASLPLPRRFAGYLLDVLVGYGYRPWRVAWWFLVCWLGGAVGLTLRRPAPASTVDTESYSAATHAFDLLVPFVDLGYDRAWQPSHLTIALVLIGWLLLATAVGAVIRRMTS